MDAPEKPTDRLIQELERTLCRLREFHSSRGYDSASHAAAARATMDLTRELAAWRKIPVYIKRG